MKYNIQFKPRAVKDFEAFPLKIRRRILASIEEMSDNLRGDVKRLTDSTPEYRLRVGDYRILFEIDEDAIVVYRIRHRREAYR
jgi:mRNA interferase RelE/StbE